MFNTNLGNSINNDKPMNTKYAMMPKTAIGTGPIVLYLLWAKLVQEIVELISQIVSELSTL